MLNIAEARASLEAHPRAKLGTEVIPVPSALNRTLAQNISTNIDLPPMDNSAMDGYAVAASNTVTKGTQFTVAHTQAAGDAPSRLRDGHAARIFTGAMLPEGANTVVIQEEVATDEGTVTLLQNTPKGANVRPRGQDICQGQTIAEQGDVITAATQALFAATGITQVPVLKPLNIALVTTGQELVPPGKPLAPGQIYNSNQWMLSGLLQTLGLRAQYSASPADTLTATCTALLDAAQCSDLIITTGGVSAGDEDHVKAAISRNGELDWWKVKLKPGKPLALGYLDHQGTATPVLALPGNPTSAFVAFLMFGVPLIRALQGAKARPLTPYKLHANFEKPHPSARAELARACYLDGKLTLHPNQSSGMVSPLSNTTGLVHIPEQTTVAYDNALDYYPYTDLFKL